jgi:hypothetical protein
MREREREREKEGEMRKMRAVGKRWSGVARLSIQTMFRFFWPTFLTWYTLQTKTYASL